VGSHNISSEGLDPRCHLDLRRTWLQLPQQRTIHQVACVLGESQVDTQGLGHRMCVAKVVNLDLGTPKHLKHTENGHSRKLVKPMLDVLVSAIFGDLDISMIIYVHYIYIIDSLWKPGFWQTISKSLMESWMDPQAGNGEKT